jgi:hypothetical protein
MTKLISVFLIGLYSASSIATEPKKNKKIEPLSESFLLFLAEMEPVDGDWVHPVDLTSGKVNKREDPTKSVKVSTQNKATQPNKQPSKQTKDGKRDDDN